VLKAPLNPNQPPTVHCGQTVGRIMMKLGMQVGLGPGHIVLDGDPAPPPKGGGTPSSILGPFLLRANGWMHQCATWYGCRPHPRELCVRWRPSPPPQQGGRAPKFSAHVCCGQTAGWIKMPLGTKVGLSPGDSVLNGGRAASLPQRGGAPSPIFSPFLLWPNGWMHQDATSYGGRP